MTTNLLCTGYVPCALVIKFPHIFQKLVIDRLSFKAKIFQKNCISHIPQSFYTFFQSTKLKSLQKNTGTIFNSSLTIILMSSPTMMDEHVSSLRRWNCSVLLCTALCLFCAIIFKKKNNKTREREGETTLAKYRTTITKKTLPLCCCTLRGVVHGPHVL